MAYKIYEGRPPALLQKRGAELLLVCFHELLVAGFAFFGPSSKTRELTRRRRCCARRRRCSALILLM